MSGSGNWLVLRGHSVRGEQWSGGSARLTFRTAQLASTRVARPSTPRCEERGQLVAWRIGASCERVGDPLVSPPASYIRHDRPSAAGYGPSTAPSCEPRGKRTRRTAWSATGRTSSPSTIIRRSTGPTCAPPIPLSRSSLGCGCAPTLPSGCRSARTLSTWSSSWCCAWAPTGAPSMDATSSVCCSPGNASSTAASHELSEPPRRVLPPNSPP